MAENPNVIIQSNPGEWNKSNGLNVFTLVDTNAGGNVRYVLQVYDKTLTTQLADLRVDANPNDVAHIDVQNILQAYTVINTQTETGSNLFMNSEAEAFEYSVKVGWEGALGAANITSTGGTYKVINGRKPFSDELWDVEPYRANFTYVPLAPDTITKPALLLTDWTYQEAKPATGRPTDYNNPFYTKQFTQRVRETDQFTLAFINSYKKVVPGPAQYPQIGRVQVVSYNGATQVDDFYVNNLTVNGGGPDTTTCEGLDVEQPYNALTFKCGPADLGSLSLGSITHYYVILRPIEDYGSGCLPIGPANQLYRFEMDQGECNDFTPIQLSWLNSFGFRDYFTFQKRNQNSLSAKRDEYYKLPGSWSDNTFSVTENEQGRKVFNQGVEETWTLRSRYLTDNEHDFLKNLFLAPHVMYRQGDSTSWYSATITSASFTEKTFRTDKMFQYEIEIKVSNNIQTARG
jgi:hypothetical protein